MLVSDTELNQKLQAVKSHAIDKGLEFGSAFILLYYYGLRISEVVYFSDIILKLNEQEVTIITPKTNRVRTLLIAPETQQAITVTSQMNVFTRTISIEIIQHFITRTIQGTWHYVGDKNINTHLFRHNYAKMMYQVEQSTRTVADAMAISQNVATRYIFSQIHQR